MKRIFYTFLLVTSLSFSQVNTVLAGPESFIGEISIFGGNFAPRNFAFCEGQLLPIQQNTALFALLGTTYGGDGRTTFALPDLRQAESMLKGARYIIALQGIFPSRN